MSRGFTYGFGGFHPGNRKVQRLEDVRRREPGDQLLLPGQGTPRGVVERRRAANKRARHARRANR